MLTTASVAIKSGSFFALAKKMTLFMVNWKHWLDEAAIAEKNSVPLKFKV